MSFSNLFLTLESRIHVRYPDAAYSKNGRENEKPNLKEAARWSATSRWQSHDVVTVYVITGTSFESLA